MTDPTIDVARSAAAILASDLGPNLPNEIEAALAASKTKQRADRYLDPVSLGSLIVAVATLAWTIYHDQRNRNREQEPEAELIARQVRITLCEQDMNLPPGVERITEVVATEIIRHANQAEELPEPATRSRTARQICGACGRAVPRLLHDRRRTVSSSDRPRRPPAVALAP